MGWRRPIRRWSTIGLRASLQFVSVNVDRDSSNVLSRGPEVFCFKQHAQDRTAILSLVMSCCVEVADHPIDDDCGRCARPRHRGPIKHAWLTNLKADSSTYDCVRRHLRVWASSATATAGCELLAFRILVGTPTFRALPAGRRIVYFQPSGTAIVNGPDVWIEPG